MALRGELLVKLLNAIRANLALVKLVFDLDQHHTALGDEATCEKLRNELQRLVDFQLNLLILDEFKDDEFAAHRMKVFERIFWRLSTSNTEPVRWGGLLGLMSTSDTPDKTAENDDTAHLQPSTAADQVKSLLALAESCSKESALIGPPPPNMKAFRRKLQVLAAPMEMWEEINGFDHTNGRERQRHNLARRRGMEIEDDIPTPRVEYGVPWAVLLMAAVQFRSHRRLRGFRRNRQRGFMGPVTAWLEHGTRI